MCKLVVSWKSISCSVRRTLLTQWWQGTMLFTPSERHSVDLGNSGLFVFILGLTTAAIGFLEVLQKSLDEFLAVAVLVLEGGDIVLDLFSVLFLSLGLVATDHDDGVEEEDAGHAKPDNEAREGDTGKRLSLVVVEGAFRLAELLSDDDIKGLEGSSFEELRCLGNLSSHCKAKNASSSC